MMAEYQAAALRAKTDPNTADKKGQLRDERVPYFKGFIEWAGLKGKNLYADYEFLYGRHSKYFSSPEEARAAVELVLSAPERVEDLNRNASFIGTDEVTGKIYRIEIQKHEKNKANHIRSVFEITPAQYQKIKLEDSPVLQPSSTDSDSTTSYRKTRTLSNFLKYNTTTSENVKNQSNKNGEKYRGGYLAPSTFIYLHCQQKKNSTAASTE